AANIQLPRPGNLLLERLRVMTGVPNVDVVPGSKPRLVDGQQHGAALGGLHIDQRFSKIRPGTAYGRQEETEYSQVDERLSHGGNTALFWMNQQQFALDEQEVS